MDATYRLPACIVVSRETGEIIGMRMAEISGEDVKSFFGDLERIARQQEAAAKARQKKEEGVS